MPRLSDRSQDRSPLAPVFRPHLPARTRAFYRSLRLELTRQRTELLQDTTQQLLPSFEAALLSDLLDQVTVDQERERCMQVKAHARFKLYQIDIALQRMEQQTYGICSRCGDDIPFDRLKVQPSALTCVACQERAEHRYAGTTVVGLITHARSR